MRMSRTWLAAALTALLAGCADQKATTAEPQLAVALRATVTVAPGTASVAAGATTQLTATARDRRGRVITGATITWTSASPAIATVSATGLVRGVTAGTAVITARNGNISGRATVTVTGGTTPPPPPPPTNTDVTFTVDGSATFTISRFIYGANVLDRNGFFGGTSTLVPFTFNRNGGNRLTAYNWENNYSNAGSDYNFQNDQLMSTSTVPGAAIREQAGPSFARGQAFMSTIPMIGYVAGDACNCNVGITDAARATRLATRFRVSRPAKGSAFTLTPDANDAVVYQDEFVHWFESTYPGRSSNTTAPVFFSLDNEPDLWHHTHKEINSDLNDNPATPRLQTYSGLADTAAAYARAIKAVAPNAMIFGPATATYTGVTTLGRYPFADPVYGTQNFADVYLDRMRAASSAAGRRLLDVFDLHYYPETGTSAGTILNDYATQDEAMVQARLQAPRSLWDPTYNDGSWVTNVTGGPIRLLPRLRDQIAAHYPGTKLAITEYYYGRGGDISGGIAQADALGVFGREGVFAASVWPLAGVWAAPYNGDANKAYAFMLGAFRMYRNYDGAGGAFGDLGVKATTTDFAATSVYASRNAAGELVLVAINKTSAPKVAGISLLNLAGLTRARVYLLSAASAVPVRQADLTLAGSALAYTMPAMSVTTLVLAP
jgi:Glycoside hydrolase family 44/Bacterial Ig-like domain (group 2)